MIDNLGISGGWEIYFTIKTDSVSTAGPLMHSRSDNAEVITGYDTYKSFKKKKSNSCEIGIKWAGTVNER